MKKDRIYKIVWVSGIYLFLIFVLFLIVQYKVKWEGRDLSKYLYFYNCSSNLCTSEIKPDKYYSKYVCHKICPRIKNILDGDIVILDGITYGAIYNYKDGKVIDDNYVSYELLDKDKIIIYNGTKKGIINLDGEVILSSNYDNIGELFGNYLSVMNNNLWGIKKLDSDDNIDYKYDYLKFVNEKTLLVMMDDKYYFIDIDGNSDNDNKYDYLYYIDDYIICIMNKKIDILDNTLRSRLVMKVDTTYEYTTDEERKSLNIVSDGEYIYFTVYTPSGYIKYKYSKERNAISY